MSLDDDFGSRVRTGARALAGELDAARRRAGLAWPEAAAWRDRFVQHLAKLAALEISPGRLLPWLPVGFGFGVVLYFTADREPSLWAPCLLALASIAVAIATRHRALGFPMALAAAAIAAGFAVATARTFYISHPVLQSAATADLSGFVEIREERAKTDRIVIRIHQISGRLDPAPDRVRLAVRKGSAPAVGEFVSLKANLTPPLQALRPGGYDFARDMYFQRIGASGYVLGAIKIDKPPVAARLSLRFAALIESIRETIDDRIREILPGDRGSIASALITGKRDAITPPVNDAMYVSSLAHVLSISGYHMAVVAGIVFFIIRASLALIPSLASRYPIKKWAAVFALIAAALYLILSGAEVATQRSFIMIAIVLIGVMFDRPALTFRTLTIAAIAVMVLAPEAVVHPSFQMSFAATLALIAAYQNGLPWRADADSSLGSRAALWGAREIAGLILASLVAGLATTPYAAFHFHRLAPYGVIANLLAMPVVSLVVMPAGILGLIAMPFGFDAPLWRLMGLGLDWMIFIAQWVANLPGAVGRMAAFGTGPLLLVTAGLLLLCLLRTRLRWSGAVVVAIACLWAAATPQPRVYVASDGRIAAVRGDNGRLSVLQTSRDSFAIREWLAADADGRALDDTSLRDNVRCDAQGCVGRLSDGRLVALALSGEAFRLDCVRTTLIVSPRDAPAECQARVIDRKTLQASGAISLFGPELDRVAARPVGHQRPWSPRSAQAPAQRPAPADATPRPGDAEADD